MFSFLFAAWALSHVAAQEQFFWSYKVENTTGSYAPLFEICGSSCSDCDPEAKACFAENWSNLCFEPKLGETCCKDQFGSKLSPKTRPNMRSQSDGANSKLLRRILLRVRRG